MSAVVKLIGVVPVGIDVTEKSKCLVVMDGNTRYALFLDPDDAAVNAFAEQCATAAGKVEFDVSVILGRLVEPGEGNQLKEPKQFARPVEQPSLLRKRAAKLSVPQEQIDANAALLKSLGL